MNRLVLVLSLAVGFGGFSGAGWAGTRSFYIDRGDMFDSRGRQSEDVSGMLLNNDGLNSVQFSMVLPKNYKKNSKVKIRLYLSGEAANCSYKLMGGLVTRARTGKVKSLSYAQQAGLEPSSFVDVPAPLIAGVGFKKDFTLSPALSGPFGGSQQAGDRITLAIDRDSVLDNCNSGLLVEDIRVDYITP